MKSKFVDKGETLEFTGRFEKIRDHWPAFVAYKTSDKKYHHHTGSGGYLKARLLGAKAENDLIAKGVEPETLNWPDRTRTWFFGVEGTLDPETGKCR